MSPRLLAAAAHLYAASLRHREAQRFARLGFDGTAAALRVERDQERRAGLVAYADALATEAA